MTLATQSTTETRLADARRRLDAALLSGESTEPHRRAIATLVQAADADREAQAQNAAGQHREVEVLQRGLAEAIAGAALVEIEADLSRFAPPAEVGSTTDSKEPQ